jgi:hypothetical protein
MLLTCTVCFKRFRCNQSDGQYCFPDKGTCKFPKCINCYLDELPDYDTNIEWKKIFFNLSKVIIKRCFDKVMTQKELDAIFLVYEL